MKLTYNQIHTDRLQEAFEFFLSKGRYDLTLVYLGPLMQWQVVRFDPDRGSWYNPENVYPQSEDPLWAAIMAIIADDGVYEPTFGRAIGAPTR